MDEELRSIKLDRPGRTKSTEQLQKHTVDTTFDNKPVERSVYLLTNGDDIQKLSIVQNLPQLYQIEPAGTLNRIIPKIQQELPSSSSEFNIVTSKIFRILIEKKVPCNLLGSIIQGIEFKDPLVVTAWFETLAAIINNLSESQIKNDVLKLALAKVQPGKPTLQRAVSCILLGKIAIHPRIDAAEVKKSILPQTKILCQDATYEVRASMGSQIPAIAQGLKDPEAIKANLLPSIVELAKDENNIVRSSSIVAIVALLPHLSPAIKTDVIIPLMKQVCTQSTEGQHLSYSIVAREFGGLLTGLQNMLTPQDCVWFLKVFKLLSFKGLVSSRTESVDPTQGVYCRHFCAQNLPTVTTFTLSKIPTQVELWYSIFRDLAADPCYIVRKTVAGNIHEICSALGPQCKIVKQDFVRLLRDDADDVLHLLVPNIGTTLETLTLSGLLSRESSTQATLEIGRAVLKCQLELSKGRNWRMPTIFMSQLEHLPNCLPSDFIHQHFTPVIFGITTEGHAKPLRAQAARTLLVFLRYNIKEIQRKWIRDNLINRLFASRSCYARHIFIKMCESAINIFSRKYFKEYFFEHITILLGDRISNIRLCAILLLPHLRSILLPEDKKLSSALDDAMKKLETGERNPEVLSVFKCVKSQYHFAIQEAMKSQNIAEDKIKQEEEAKIAAGKIVENIRSNEGLPLYFKTGAENMITKVAMPSSSSKTSTIQSSRSSYRG